MRFDSLLLADAIDTSGGRLYIHGGGVTRIDAPILPWTHPQLAFLIRLLAQDTADLQAPHRLGIRVDGPDGEVVIPETVFEAGLPADAPLPVDGEEPYRNLTLTASPLTFPRPGVYTIHLALDGQEVHTMRLLVSPVTDGPLETSEPHT